MRVAGVDVRDSAVVAVWWVGAGEHRAVLRLSSAQRVDLVDRLLERLPGAAAHEQSMRVALGALVDAGRSVAVQARGFDQWFGLVRPFALGDVDGAEVTLSAVVRAGALSFPLLTADAAAAGPTRRRSTSVRDGRWRGSASASSAPPPSRALAAAALRGRRRRRLSAR